MTYHDFSAMTQDEFNALHRRFVRKYPSLEDFFDAAVENAVKFPIPSHLELVGTLGHIARQKLYRAKNMRRINPYSGTLVYLEDCMRGDQNPEEMFGYLPEQMDSEEFDILQVEANRKLSPRPDWYRYAERECRNAARGTSCSAAWKRRLRLLELYLELVEQDLYELNHNEKFNLFFERMTDLNISRRTLSDDLTHVRRVCEYWIAYCKSTLPQKYAAP